MAITIKVGSFAEAKKLVPVHITATVTSDVAIKNIEWLCNKPVHFTISLDQKTYNFTPSDDGVYVFTITVWDINGARQSATSTITVGGTVPNPTPSPEPIPTPTGVKYDSNVQGKWNNGVVRFVQDKEGNTGPDGFGFTVNASGGGGIRINGAGQANIEPMSAGHRRMYICCCNYNGRLEGEFCFLDSKPRNFSIKDRSRHQYADMVDSNAPDSKKQGGIGIAFSIEDQKMEFGIEVVHGTNTGDDGASLPKPLEVGKWYKYRYTLLDTSSSSTRVKVELDYQDGQGFRTIFDKVKGFPSVFYNKADFDTWSQFWLRLNDEGKIGNRNVRFFPL